MVNSAAAAAAAVAPVSANASVKVAMYCLFVFSLFSTIRLSLKMGHNDHTLRYAQENLDAPSKIKIKVIGDGGYIEEEEEEQQQQQREESFEPFNDDDDKDDDDDDDEDDDEDDDKDEDEDDSFSACILWMDDNHRLEEWLAYHYYLLKLRYVVINIDPSSKTSPNAIIDRWNDHENKYNLNMTIVTMTNSDYMLKHQNWLDKIEKARLSPHSDLLYGKEKTNYHRKRQHEFYKACSQHLMERNKSWYVLYEKIWGFVFFFYIYELCTVYNRANVFFVTFIPCCFDSTRLYQLNSTQLF